MNYCSSSGHVQSTWGCMSGVALSYNMLSYRSAQHCEEASRVLPFNNSVSKASRRIEWKHTLTMMSRKDSFSTIL
jgi:hypothetical protein